MVTSKFYTVKEAAKILGLSEYTVRKKIRENVIKIPENSDTNKRLPSKREGYRIPEETLENYSGRRIVSSDTLLNSGTLTETEKIPNTIKTLLDIVNGEKSETQENSDFVFNSNIKNLLIDFFNRAIRKIDLNLEALQHKQNEKLSEEEREKVIDLEIAKEELEQQITLINLSYELNGKNKGDIPNE